MILFFFTYSFFRDTYFHDIFHKVFAHSISLSVSVSFSFSHRPSFSVWLSFAPAHANPISLFLSLSFPPYFSISLTLSTLYLFFSLSLPIFLFFLLQSRWRLHAISNQEVDLQAWYHTVFFNEIYRYLSYHHTFISLLILLLSFLLVSLI